MALLKGKHSTALAAVALLLCVRNCFPCVFCVCKDKYSQDSQALEVWPFDSQLASMHLNASPQEKDRQTLLPNIAAIQEEGLLVHSLQQYGFTHLLSASSNVTG